MPSRRRAPHAAATAALLASALPMMLRAQDPLQGWRVDAQAKAMALVRVEQSGATTRFVFQNVSEKTVTAFSASFGTTREPSVEGVDCFTVDASLCWAPGASYPFIELTAQLPPAPDRVIHVLAAIFEDGDAEGEQSTIDHDRFHRLGTMFEIERVRGILGAPAEDYASEAGVKLLIAKIGKEPGPGEDPFASFDAVSLPGVSLATLRRGSKLARNGFFAGVVIERRWALKQAQDVLSPPGGTQANSSAPAPTAAITQMRQRYEANSAKYRAFCQRTNGGIPR